MRMRLELVCITSVLFCASLIISADSLAQKSKRKKAKPADHTIVLTEGGFSRFRIVLPSFPTQHETKASEVLQKYLLEISGAALPIVSTRDVRSRYEIVLGQNERLDELNLHINLNSLKEDGFIIRTDSARLIIAAAAKGVLYMVCTPSSKIISTAACTHLRSR